MKKRKHEPSLAELARKLGVSRQRMWQVIKKAEGLCVVCGQPRGDYSWYCDKHAQYARDKEWAKGKRVRRNGPYGGRAR